MNPLMNEKEAAKYLGLSARTLQNWRNRGDGPKFLRISRRAVRYRQEHLDDWLEGFVEGSTSGMTKAELEETAR